MSELRLVDRRIDKLGTRTGTGVQLGCCVRSEN